MFYDFYTQIEIGNSTYSMKKKKEMKDSLESKARIRSFQKYSQTDGV